MNAKARMPQRLRRQRKVFLKDDGVLSTPHLFISLKNGCLPYMSREMTEFCDHNFKSKLSISHSFNYVAANLDTLKKWKKGKKLIFLYTYILKDA